MEDAKQRFSYPFGGNAAVLTSDDPGLLGGYLVERDKLGINEVLDELVGRNPFFLIASTGLGKTVIVPLYLLVREMTYGQTEHLEIVEQCPRIWVVEPKIAIAQSLHQVMNLWWSEYVDELRPDLKGFNLFGCKTKVDHKDVDAPIMFITTGIFSIYARKGMFEPGRDTILIDEAHVTLETDEALELGIGICRQCGVALNYMSATVDVTDIPQRLGARTVRAEKKRFPVWKHNLLQPIDNILVDLVERTLVHPEEGEEYFPAEDDKTWHTVRKAVFEQNRAKGMLVIVNSYTADESDAKRLERMLKEASFADKIAVRTLAGEVLRDPKRRAVYEADLKRWKEQKARYVLIATSVVEMGVTLPDLDFVVSMDSTLGEVENGVRIGPLGTNALIQRIGRVGRERPGIAYISRDIGAPYSLLSDEELNDPDALKPELIQWPTERGSLEWLAYYSLDQQWDSLDLLKRLLELKMPSGVATRWKADQLEEVRQTFIQAGLAEDNSLTDKGREVEGWLGFRPLEELRGLRGYVQTYDTLGFFSHLLQAAAGEEARDQCDDEDEEYRVRRVSEVFLASFNELPKRATDWYAEAMAWDRLETNLNGLEIGWSTIVSVFRRTLRIVEEADIHIEREFKADRHERARTFQQEFWNRLRSYTNAFKMLIRN
jgi:hypothetical protein